MIETYDKRTGDGNWLRQSLKIFKQEMKRAQRIESQMDWSDRGANVAGNVTAADQKDLQGCSAG